MAGASMPTRAWLRAKYDDFVQSVNGVAVNYAGNVPVNVPQQVSNIWLTWAFAPNWSVNGGVQIVGKTFADNANTLAQPATMSSIPGMQVEAGRPTLRCRVPGLQFVRQDLCDLERHGAVAARHAAHRRTRPQRQVLTMSQLGSYAELRRWLYVVHRWIGIGTCLLFAMWFMSGVVMMYVAFPQLTDTERLMASPPIAGARCRSP